MVFFLLLHQQMETLLREFLEIVWILARCFIS